LAIDILTYCQTTETEVSTAIYFKGRIYLEKSNKKKVLECIKALKKINKNVALNLKEDLVKLYNKKFKLNLK